MPFLGKEFKRSKFADFDQNLYISIDSLEFLDFQDQLPLFHMTQKNLGYDWFESLFYAEFQGKSRPRWLSDDAMCQMLSTCTIAKMTCGFLCPVSSTEWQYFISKICRIVEKIGRVSVLYWSISLYGKYPLSAFEPQLIMMLTEIFRVRTFVLETNFVEYTESVREK